jgi:hypothetical protein
MRLLGHITHTLLETKQVAADGPAIEENLAVRGLDQPGNHLHGGGFAGAVRPQVSGDLAGARLKAYVIHGRDATESFGDVA